jgi:hypothetical protein
MPCAHGGRCAGFYPILRSKNTKCQSALTFVSWLLVHYGHSGLELFLELVEKSPVRALGDELFRTRLDEADLVQTQSMEAERVLGIGISPAAIRQVLQNCQCHLVARLVPLGGQIARRPLRFLRAEIRGLQEGAQRASRRDRILLGECTAGTDHAAEILRPGAILEGIEDDTADLLGPQLFALWSERKECIRLAVHEGLERVGCAGRSDPVYVAWVDTDVGDDTGEEEPLGRIIGGYRHTFALEILGLHDLPVHEQLVAASMDTREWEEGAFGDSYGPTETFL